MVIRALAVFSMAATLAVRPVSPEADAEQNPWSVYGTVPAAVAALSCDGYCIICEFGGDPKYKVFPLPEWGNDGDEEAMCGHHVPCQGCLQSSLDVEQVETMIKRRDRSGVERLLNGPDGGRLVLSVERRAIQVLGCANMPFVAHLPLDPPAYEQIAPLFDASRRLAGAGDPN